MSKRYRFVEHVHHGDVVRLPPEDCHLLVSSGRWVALTRREGRAKLRANSGRLRAYWWRKVGIAGGGFLAVLAVFVWLRVLYLI